MPGPEESTLLNFIRMLLEGTDLNEEQKAVLLRPDRSLSVWSQLVGTDGTRQRIVAVDPNGLLRIRPFEALFPITSILMPAAVTTAYTSTAARSTVRVDVVNSADNADATCSVVRDVDGVSGSFQLLGPTTPVLRGVGLRVGHFDLDAGGTIRGSSSPANSCTLTVTVEQYSPTGDTP